MVALLGLSKIRAIDARNGPDGIRLAREHKPDIVLCDLTMPDMHGLEVCAAFRGDPDLAPCRLVILSARADDIDAPQLGDADAFLGKPFTPRELEALVQRLRAAGPRR
jgi:CheY-like chemotaxis protein